MKDLKLGKQTQYSDKYDPSLLQSVPRSLSRDNIGLSDTLPFNGADIWNAYEVSWLNPKGKPIVAIMRCVVPYNSTNLIESKSFKLYLNSFNQTHFLNSDEVVKTITKDLSLCAEGRVSVNMLTSNQFNQCKIGDLPGTIIDDLDIEINEYDISLNPLKTHTKPCEETLVTHLLKSNCLITNQPDWGSLMVRYSGPQIDKASLLKYIISFRQHNEFHEQCVERIFCDILNQCKPNRLSVYARYTRRGGLDINPFRSNFETPYDDIRLARQ